MQALDAEILWCEQNPDKAFHVEYRKGFVNGLIQAKYLITEGNRMACGDEPELHITDKDTCSNCDYQFDFDIPDTLKFYVEESGVQPGTVHGPAIHWAYGVIICPNCFGRLPFETSS